MQSIITKCYFCGSPERSREIENHTNKGISYTLHECIACGVQYWTPFNNPGGRWYEQDERYKGANSNPIVEPTKDHKMILKFLAPFKGKIFDIGCGTGNFLYLAKNMGWEVSGIDFDRNAINTAKVSFTIPNVELATLNEYVAKHRNDNTKYDLVTFFDVFEHIDNHQQFIEQVKGLLKPNGHVAMSMPYRYGSKWLQPHDLPPRHLTRWSRTSLKNFLVHHGFSILCIRRHPASFWFILMKLRFRYGRLTTFNLVKKVERMQSPAHSENLMKRSGRIIFVHILARLKDLLIFGAPAFFIWLWFLPQRSRYIGLFVIAQK